MKKLLLLLVFSASFFASAQNYYVIPSTTANVAAFEVVMDRQDVTGGFLLDINDEQFNAIDDAVLGQLDGIPAIAPSGTLSGTLRVDIPVTAFTTPEHFGFTCNPNDGRIENVLSRRANGDVGNDNCGGGLTLTHVLFAFDTPGIYLFDWEDDAYDERTSPIVIWSDGTLVVYPSIIRE